MSHPQVFLSFDVQNDESNRADFASQSDNCVKPFNVSYWSEEIQSSAVDWTNRVRDKINRCDLMIVLVGKQIEDCSNIALELRLAKERNVPYFGIYLGQPEESPGLPSSMAANRTIPYDWQRIATAIEQLMHEGKHHVFR